MIKWCVVFLFILSSLSASSISYDKIKALANPLPLKSNEEPHDNKEADLQLYEIRTNLVNNQTDNFSELNYLIRYVAFGILIAIFSMNSIFRRENKNLVIGTSVAAMLSLSLNFGCCFYLYKKAPELLEISYKKKVQDIVSMYGDLVAFSNKAFCTITIILFVATILFCFLGYKYLFYIDSDRQHIKRRKE